MRLNNLLILMASLFLIGCGDGEDRVTKVEGASNANVVVPLAIGESKTFALNLRVDESYLVTTEVKTVASKKVDYRVDYLNRTYPEIVVTGVSSGTEDFIVTAEDASGRRQQALIRANVLAVGDINGTAIDIATDPSGGSGTDGNDSNGGDNGGGDNGGGTTPPVINPISDPEACNDSDPTWGTVTDSWGTTEGAFTAEKGYWMKSQIPLEPSAVTMYYQKQGITNEDQYYSLGRYRYQQTSGKEIIVDALIAQELVGKATKIYFKFGKECYRATLPSSIFMAPDNTLTPVFSANLF